jgi:plasmid stabilization system protein ParE
MGGPGTRVQTFAEDRFRFRCYVDPLGTSRFVAVPGDIVIDVVAGAPAALALVGTRFVRPNTPYVLRVNAHDRWGNACVDVGGEVDITATCAGKIVYQESLELGAKGWATAAITRLPRHSGELTVTARLPKAQGVAEAVHYVTIDETAPCPRLFYGDLHVHAHDTVGTNSPAYNTAYGRDIAGLDVISYTANDFQITDENWALGVKTMDEFNKDGELVCYPVQEWCGSSTAGGDHNVVFLHGKAPEFPYGRGGEHNRTFTWNEDMKGTGVDLGRWPIEELWLAYSHDPENHLIMPHVGGRRYIPDWHHPGLEKLIEISSSWGHFGWLYQDVIARGYKLGASASGDEHRGRPGGGLPGTQVFGVKGGITGIIADTLDRATVGRALRARHTFAATGERLGGFTRCGRHMQGDEFSADGAVMVDYRFLGGVGWDEIAAYDHTGCIWRRDLQKEAGYSERRVRVRWGGARIPDRYRWAEWRGTISVVNGIIHSFAGGGFEHPEESVWRAGPTDIGVRTDTYGDADSVVIDIGNLSGCRIRFAGRIDGYSKTGNPLEGNPFVHCPTFDWEVTGAELLQAGSLRMELGGTELFLAIERVTDAPLPRDVGGSLQIEARNGPHGFRPVYFHGRQSDDAKVWTSALFIEFE